MARQSDLNQQSLEGLATLIEEHESNGSPFIEAPGVLEAVREILVDAGYLEEGEEDEDEDEDEEDAA